MNPLEERKRMVKPRLAAVALPSSDETRQSTGCEENTLDREELVKKILKEESGQKESDREM